MSARIYAGQLCIIEPGPNALPDEAAQLMGLPVTTISRRGVCYWRVSPNVTVTYRESVRDANERVVRAGMAVEWDSVPESWLRPIGGNQTILGSSVPRSSWMAP